MRFKILLLVLAGIFAPAALAEDDTDLSPIRSSEGERLDHDMQVWPKLIITVPVYRDVISGYTEIIPFFTQDASRLNRVQIRTAAVYKPFEERAGRKLPVNLTLWQGLDYFPSNVAPDEFRSWQQAQITKTFKRRSSSTQEAESEKPEWDLAARARLEERFIEKVNKPVFRLRSRVKLRRYLGQSARWYLFGGDEIFFVLNTAEPSFRSGFGENRIFGGLGRVIIPQRLDFELGYTFSHVNNRNPRADQIRHIIGTELSLKL